ncbi:MAG: bifunctional hydroxymethylpyrimidine kinase/phosphomethylpyrimidine kinase [Aerococcus sp.]|nr:bifunctional hydroxymethylpyrimidine kinase/phosphomethylpyrimidine kinase [Aerococcus sp.]
MTETLTPPQVLTIAGTDSSGGAGMQADLKTMQECQVFGTCVVVAVTAQNTQSVLDFIAMPKAIIDHQFQALANDLTITAAKTGMLANREVVEAVATNYQKYDFGPLIVDPIMIAKGGAKLLSEDAIQAVKEYLLPLAYLITPNLPEAEKLAGMTIETLEDMDKAAQRLRALGAKNILIKGGHADHTSESVDVLYLENGETHTFVSPRIDTQNTHGTGDTLSSVITAEIAKGADLITALQTAKDFTFAAIKDGIHVGHGHGPLNHWAYRTIEGAHHDI